MKKTFFILTSSILFFNYTLKGNDTYYISDKKLTNIENTYGKKAKKRFLLLDKTMQEVKDKNIFYKLNEINNFWNKVKYKEDIDIWQEKEHYSTPFEFLGVGAGDSEDFALAKYFTLKKVGVSAKKLKFLYVLFLDLKQKYQTPHMVLAYYHHKNATPIILDNINKNLELITKRDDFLPINEDHKNFPLSSICLDDNCTISVKVNKKIRKEIILNRFKL